MKKNAVKLFSKGIFALNPACCYGEIFQPTVLLFLYMVSKYKFSPENLFYYLISSLRFELVL